MIGGLLWMLIPYLDRKAAKERKSHLFTLIGLVVLIYMIVFTAITYLVPNL